MTEALRIHITTPSSTIPYDVGDFALDDLLELQPRAEALLRDVRKRIGRMLREMREARGLSLEDVQRLSRRRIDSAGLSRVERGEAWSDRILTKTYRLLQAHTPTAAMSKSTSERRETIGTR